MFKKIVCVLCAFFAFYVLCNAAVAYLAPVEAAASITVLISIIVFCAQGAIFGLVTHSIAESKGYEGGFWWGFFLSLLGVLVVAVRPARPTESVVAQTQSSTAANYAATLEQLAKLKDQGILTEAEYNQKKQKILSQI